MMTPRAVLTALLAERIMSWRVGPDRFIKSGHTWIPRWRFAPFSHVEDAFRLLNQASKDYKLARINGIFTVEVHMADRVGTAIGGPLAETMTVAVVRALGLDRGETKIDERSGRQPANEFRRTGVGG
jgi:hypothetical protein